MDLILGDTSQLSHYMPNGLVRVDSRNIPNEVFDRKWNRVYLLFAEQRTIHNNDSKYKHDFYNTNVDLTIQVAKRLKADVIVYFSTTELWNLLEGAITIDTTYQFEQNYYTDTKYMATVEMKKLENVLILYPFNFNSVHRSEDYLFGKVFASVLNERKIKVGNLDIVRDLLHASWVANRSIIADCSQIIGSGTYFNVRQYIRDVYQGCGLSPDDLLEETSEFATQKKLFYLKTDEVLYDYAQLLRDTIHDIRNTTR